MSIWEIYDFEVLLDLIFGSVMVVYCICKVGNSGYCNYIMCFFFEFVCYFLEELDRVLEEVVCISMLRKWGILGKI